MNLGNKIRELRREKQLTQEQLASALNISPQAVSKWEMNIGYPDMSLIPIIAGYFKVSLDALFEYDINKVDEQIEHILTEGKAHFWNNPAIAEQIFLDGIKAYPASDKLKSELLDLYVSNAPGKYHGNVTVKIMDIANKIILESQDIFCVCRAKANIADVYSEQGRYDDAKAVIKSLPYMYPYMLQDRMRCSAYALRGDDRLAEAKNWKEIEQQELFIACAQEGKGYYETGNYGQALISYTESRDVIERFMILGKQGYSAYPIGGTHSNHAYCILMIAGCKYKLKQTNDMDELIETAKRVYFNALTREDFSSEREFEKNITKTNATFKEWYCTDAELDKYKHLILDIQ